MKALTALLVLVLAGLSHADGKYFSSNASVRSPDMPRQRAVLVYKDGVQTLIVESVVATEGEQELAWIVPVPGEPTEIGFATEGTVATLPNVLGPEIMTGEQNLIYILATVAVILFFYCVSTVGVRPVSVGRFFAEVLASLAIVAVVLAFLFPVFASAGSSRPSIGEWQETEGMEFATIGGTTQDVGGWLAKNGFRLDASITTALDDYSKDNWFFVACRTRPVKGESAPKPLKISCATQRPVYPMKLTGAGLDRLHLDLVVISETPVRASVLDHYETLKWDDSDPATMHPEILKLVWHGAYVTRMAGRLSGEALSDDIWLDESGSVGKSKFGTVQTFLMIAVQWTLGLLCVGMVVGGAFAVAKGWSRNAYATVGFFVPITIGLLYGLAMALFVPKVDVDFGSRFRERREATHARLLAERWAKNQENEEQWEREYGQLVGTSGWGKDVPLGVMKDGGYIVYYDREGNPRWFPIEKRRLNEKDP